MKKLFSLLLCLCLMLGLVPVMVESAAETTAAQAQLFVKTYPVYFRSTTETWRDDFPLYFTEGAEDLPFVSIEDWKDFLCYTMNTLDEAGEMAYQLKYESLEAEKKVTLTRENGFQMIFDFEAGSLTFPDFFGFLNVPSQQYLDISGFPATDKEGKPFLLNRTKSRTLYGDITVIDLNDYNIPMIMQDGKALLPMQTLAAFTLSEASFGLYFNGDALYAAEIGKMTDPKNNFLLKIMAAGLMTPEVIEIAQNTEGTMDTKIMAVADAIAQLSETGKELAEAFKEEMTNGILAKYRAGADGTRSDALVEYGFCELALEMDCYYGLKQSHNIKDFRLFFLQNDLCTKLLDKSAEKADQAIADLTQFWFDDSHSQFLSSSYLSASDPDTISGFAMSSMSNIDTKIATFKAQYPNSLLPYYEVGDTAYVTFDEFMITEGDMKGVADYYKLAEEGNLPDDTLGVIINAHRQITRENSPIKNVVLDLSNNGGGMAPAACFTLGWFLGDANFSVQNTFTGAQSTQYFQVDVNLDHQFDENDTLANRGLNLYCLISPKSFSCGNLVPWVFKESGEVTLLGKTSGGGSCVVAFATTAWGTSYRYSGARRLAFMKNGSYYDVDKGVDPDHIIDTFDHFYDREALTEYIHGLY
jgi:hypothetical protein